MTSEVSSGDIAVDDPRLVFQTLAHATVPPNTTKLDNIKLGRFDPTILLNGGYVLRVCEYLNTKTDVVSLNLQYIVVGGRSSVQRVAQQ